jgi:hypothetical protein
MAKWEKKKEMTSRATFFFKKKKNESGCYRHTCSYPSFFFFLFLFLSKLVII